MQKTNQRQQTAAAGCWVLYVQRSSRSLGSGTIVPCAAMVSRLTRLSGAKTKRSNLL